MKTLITITSFIALLLPFQSAQALNCRDTVRIMPLGDSVTYGLIQGQSDANTTGYRLPLFEKLDLRVPGYFDFVGSQSSGAAYPEAFDLDHEGHSGFTAQQIDAEVTRYLTANPPDFVLLHLGTNGLSSYASDPYVHSDYIESVLDRIESFDPGIRVIVARIINHQTPEGYISVFNDILEAAVSGHRNVIAVVDMENALSYPDDMSDQLHPNASGYEKMAEVWYEGLRKSLPKACSNLVKFKDKLNYKTEVFNENDDVVQLTGNWQTVATGLDGQSLQSLSGAAGTATYETDIRGVQELDIRWVANAFRDNAVLIEVFDGSELLESFTVNQSKNGDTWRTMGNYQFDDHARIVFHADSSWQSTSVDAIRFTKARKGLLKQLLTAE